MSAPRIAVLTDADPAVGRGHLSRSSALVGALREAGAEVQAVALHGPDVTWDGVAWSRGAPEAPVVVLDSYRDEAPAAERLVVFADDSRAPEQAALVVAPAAPEAPDARWLTGLEHACLRRAYWSPEAVRSPGPVRRALVSAGAADAATAESLATELAEALPGAQVTVARGLPDLASELRRSDLFVGAAGQTLLEALACGVPAVTFTTAANQERQAVAVRDAGAALVAADHASAAALAAHLAQDAPRREALAARAREVVDGQGARRVAARVLALG